MTSSNSLRRLPFLSAVFLITFSILIFQIAQTRILSVIIWYHLAFFAISVAMLGMTVGAVWLYLWRERFQRSSMAVTLSNFSLATALAMPASVSVQFCLVTPISLSLTTLVSWSLLLIAMAAPYVFSGVVVSLALTRGPFPTGLVYGVDLLGAALGCVAVIGLLNVVDGPTSVVLSGAISGLSAVAFAASASSEDQKRLKSRSWWQRPAPVVIALIAFALLNSLAPVGTHPMRPILVKNNVEGAGGADDAVYERWNSYSRIVAMPSYIQFPAMWGASPKLPSDTRVSEIDLNMRLYFVSSIRSC